MLEVLQQKAKGALRWSEKYTKTDMVYLVSGGFWLTLGCVWQFFMSLALSVVLTRFMPKDAYGVYQFIISTCAILGGFTLTGMGTALMRTTARDYSGALLYGFKKQLFWSIGIILASGITALFYFAQGNNGLATAFLFCGVLLPFFTGFSLYRPFLEGKRLFRESTVIGLWRRPIPVIAMAIAVFVTKSPIVLSITYFASQTISMGMLFWLTAKKYPEPKGEHAELLNYSKHLSVMRFIGLITLNIDNILVFNYLGAVPLAVYAVAQIPFTQLTEIFGLIGNLMIPKFARREFYDIRQKILLKAFFYALVAGAVVVAYLLVAPFAFRLLYPIYPEAVPLSQMLILSLLLKPAMLYSQTFAAHGMKGVQHFVQYSSTAVKVLLLIIFLPIFGIWGAVWSILLMNAYSALAVVVLFYMRKN